MEHLDRGRRFPSGGSSELLGAAALLRWDELEPGELRRLERDERGGPLLTRLRAAEHELRRTLDARPCPASEELYDFAGGPGARDLGAERRAELEDHVAHCVPCAGFGATLATAPPPPLELDGEAPLGGDLAGDPIGPGPAEALGAAGPFAEPDADFGPRPTPAAPLRRTGWLPLAAAAAVLVAGLGLFHGDGAVEAADWPERPLLRHTGQQALWFPRGPVLSGGVALSGGAPTYEFAAIPGAERVRVRVLFHDGGAFVDGAPVDEIEGVGSPLQGNAALAPGHYTWEVWARIDGLDQPQGELDFRVVREGPPDGPGTGPTTTATLAELRRLHEAGFVTDARALARTLPPSPERDEYLAPPSR